MGVRILIAEDNYTLRRLYLKSLENFDAEIIEADSAKETMELVSSDMFDMVICDIEMGDGMNFETIEAAAGMGIPVIAISAFENYADECLRRGATTFFSKPFPTRTLANAVRAQFEAPTG
ncbi:MAG: response regulator [Chloroflexota bacterium]